MIILKESNGPEVLYHAVTNRSYDYVKKNGITPDEDGFVYLSTYPLKSGLYKNGHVFQVKIPNHSLLYDWREFWQDEEGNDIDFDHEWDPENPYYIYMGFIPAEFIKEV